MAHLNDNFLKLSANYLFSEVSKKANAFRAVHPEAELISMGIGDVTLPLSPSVVKALHDATDEMANAATFRGYGPEHGYMFLREKIVNVWMKPRGVEIDPDEIFISDGAKSDIGNMGDIFADDTKIAIADPVYPVYIDSTVMFGRSGNMGEDGKWDGIIYMPCLPENGFMPQFPKERADIIILCYPNNPTGTTLTKAQLKEWVDYARENESIIIYDTAYEAFVKDPETPRSIYEVEGAKEVAIEIHTFSKTAGFTGMRCGYTIVPKALKARNAKGELISLNGLWNRRQTTKFNGTAYIIQKAAEATLTEQGMKECNEMIDYYMRNAKLLKEAITEKGLEAYGGKNAPYIWVKTPRNLTSWEFFDEVLADTHIICTPGIGFGPAGEGFVRFTAFGTYENTLKAIDRIKKWDVKL